jgi:hypothetical protein
MISDFVSAELGFLASPDKNDRCHVEFSAGINNQRYFTNEHMKHVFVFNDATMHMK